MSAHQQAGSRDRATKVTPLDMVKFTRDAFAFWKKIDQEQKEWEAEPGHGRQQVAWIEHVAAPVKVPRCSELQNLIDQELVTGAVDQPVPLASQAARPHNIAEGEAETGGNRGEKKGDEAEGEKQGESDDAEKRKASEDADRKGRLAAWAATSRELQQQWDECKQEFEKAKKQVPSELGPSAFENLCKDLAGNAARFIEPAQAFFDISVNTKNKTVPAAKFDSRDSELYQLQKDIKLHIDEARKLEFAWTNLPLDGEHIPGHLGRAMEIKETFGIRFSDLKTEQYDDRKLAPNIPVETYSGKVNRTYKLTYRHDETHDETMFFKPEPPALEYTASERPILFRQCGIDISAPRLGNRNIATRAMSDAIGTTVIPKVCYTRHDGEIGLLMEQAPGVDVKNFKGFNTRPVSEKLVASLHEQLNQLEWTDMLTGQSDRTTENYFIADNGDSVKITGIDNDFCFGSEQDAYKKYGAGPGGGTLNRRHYGYRSADLPTLIDKKIYDNLMETNFDSVKDKLMGLLSGAEIKASEKRFNAMKGHAKSLAPNYVVEDWESWRSPPDAKNSNGMTASNFLKHSGSLSMFQRDFQESV